MLDFFLLERRNKRFLRQPTRVYYYDARELSRLSSLLQKPNMIKLFPIIVYWTSNTYSREDFEVRFRCLKRIAELSLLGRKYCELILRSINRRCFFTQQRSRSNSSTIILSVYLWFLHFIQISNHFRFGRRIIGARGEQQQQSVVGVAGERRIAQRAFDSREPPFVSTGRRRSRDSVGKSGAGAAQRIQRPRRRKSKVRMWFIFARGERASVRVGCPFVQWCFIWTFER